MASITFKQGEWLEVCWRFLGHESRGALGKQLLGQTAHLPVEGVGDGQLVGGVAPRGSAHRWMEVGREEVVTDTRTAEGAGGRGRGGQGQLARRGLRAEEQGGGREREKGIGTGRRKELTTCNW